jgi:hypothetical protein
MDQACWNGWGSYVSSLARWCCKERQKEIVSRIERENGCEEDNGIEWVRLDMGGFSLAFFGRIEHFLSISALHGVFFGLGVID